MAAPVDKSQEDQIKDLLEEIDLHKFIRDDTLTTMGECEQLREIRETLRAKEVQLAELLGDPIPPPEAAITPPVATPIPQTSTHTQTPAPAPAPPPLPSSGFAGFATGPHWSSAGPSPFATASRSPAVMQSSPALSSLDDYRKRPRPTSGSSPPVQSPAKRSAASQPVSRRSKLGEIDARQQREIDEHQEQYGNLISMALNDEEIQDLVEERDSIEKDIISAFQLERDAELARALQCEEDSVPLPNNFTHQPSWNMPHRTQPIKPEPGLNGFGGPSQYTPFLPSSRLNQYDQSSDDGFEEITADSFNSRMGNSRMGKQPALGNPYLPSSSSSYASPFYITDPSDIPNYTTSTARNLPWSKPSYNGAGPGSMYWSGTPGSMPGTFPGMYDPYGKAGKYDPYDNFDKTFDLVREQQEMFDDDVDIAAYNEREFPDDIKNLLGGIKDIREATKADNEETPPALRVTLMKHQKVGFKWMKAKEESSHKGGILADDMGLGKTVQAIALMVARPFEDENRRPNLIVAPKALMEQWKLEIERHVKTGVHQLAVLIYHSKRRPWRELKKYDVVITTYGTLMAHYKTLLEGENMEKEGRDASLVSEVKARAGPLSPGAQWHRVIIDEAQNIKNPAAKSAIACCRLNSTYRWCLTGTPMMNRLEDFQSLLGFLRIKPYNNPKKFKQDFVSRIKSGWGGEDVMKQLRVLVKSVCLRRTKASKIDGEPILQLPPKVTEKVHVLFDEKESQVYGQLDTNTQRQINRLLDAGTLGRNYSHVLVLLLRLRQACCHPLLMKEFRSDAAASAATSAPGVDKIANAKLLTAVVVQRIMSNDDEESGTCPVCMDSVENATIYIPCGHHVCSECWIRISDSAGANVVNLDDDTVIKCQNCRGPVDPKKLTDTVSFKKVHDPTSVPEPETTEEVAADAEDSEATASSTESSDSDSDTEGGESSTKKKSLAELRTASLKNKAEKKKYLRRLEKTWFPSSKITKTLEILQANEDRGQGEKTIIFSQFTSLLDLLQVPLDRNGWNSTRFDGSMNLKERNDAVTTFTNDPNCKIMLVSLKAGNSGLNLVAASHIIMFDPFWNPYIEDQAVDRAHRIGQVREVFVHRLLIEGTVEDRIVTLQDQKRELISGALDEGGTMNVSRLDTRELAYLFGVRDL
ncbi:SNF2-related protein [Penicillium brevicompactum]|uniref:SNF2-related protein n=1 Tax=Penicillium brevicompactum TaxID=5074 RepID=A0A9W9ULB8_PENBR|nr:SNF2-related protein [Penicillium brevicompactum]